MARIKQIFHRLRQMAFGRMKVAVKEGMKVGKGCSEMSGVNYGSEPYLITLGDYVRISSDVQFVTHDGGSWVIRREGKYKGCVRFGRIRVGNNVFIGAKSIILPDVTIGNNVVVGCGSIVTKSVPDGVVVAGVPAKIVSTIDEYGEKMMSRMPKDWNAEELDKNKKEYLEFACK